MQVLYQLQHRQRMHTCADLTRSDPANQTHCFETLLDTGFNYKISESEVQWCLTVPAIWKDDQKNAMREAAALAGLVDHKESDQLKIILEPEAALLHSRVSELDQMTPGTTVMMIDAGGGTVDLTAHTIQSQASGHVELAEAAAGMGGFCGSTFVDGNFEEWLRRRVGSEAFDDWKHLYHNQYQDVRVV
jgi:hypothetical protein